VVRRYAITGEPPAIIGNYIDVQRFAPGPNILARERMVFVGRISAQKNLDAAIRASASAGIGLDIIGDGPDLHKLRVLAERLDADILWLGLLSNDDLPEVLATYRYFLLPSLWEGMPKALLEAMAMGLICIGNNALGINEVIKDGLTGYLSPSPCPDDIATTIRRALVGDRERVAFAAREFVRSTFSLEAVAAKEREVFSTICPGMT
jgi:glycosyltransferase involved in cell wall biosynthesis